MLMRDRLGVAVAMLGLRIMTPKARSRLWKYAAREAARAERRIKSPVYNG